MKKSDEKDTLMRAFSIILVVVILPIFVFAIFYGIDRKEVADCTRLREQSKEHDTFFLAQWQYDMCKQNGFTFVGHEHAPIHVETVDGELQQGIWYTDGIKTWEGKLEVNLK